MSLAPTRLRVGILGTLALAYLGACSMLVDLDGYTGGDAGAQATADASNDVVGADGTSNGPDAAATDGGADSPPLADSSAQDSGSQDSGPPLGFCASQSPAPLFCDDFDTKDLSMVWDFIGNTRGAPARDPSLSVSAPDSLVVPIQALSANQNMYAVVAKQFSQFSGKKIHGTIAFDLRIDAMDTHNGSDGLVAIFGTVSPSGGVNWSLQLDAIYSAGGITLTFVEYETAQDGGADWYQEYVFPKKIALHEWHTFQITFNLQVIAALPNGQNTASIAMDGTTMGSLTLKAPVLPFAPEIDLGSTYIMEPSDAWTLHYDNAWANITSP
jgi:hypothetical protein